MMKKTSFGLAALIFLLFTACSGNVKTTTNLTIPIDARALYNELAPRAADKDADKAADEFTIKLSINLYVNNNFFDSANTTITENTTQVELDFERVPVGAMVKATGLLEWDGKTANATSNTVKVEEYGTSLILSFDLTDGNGGNSGEEGGNDQPQDKDSLPVTSTFDVTTPDDVRIQITVTLPQTIYLNNGKINLSAKNAQTQETIPVTDAQLYYGGNKVTDSMYTYNDGLFSLKQSNKLVAPGDYQLYVTAGQSNSCASCIVDLEVQNKEYYEYSIEGMEDPDDLGIMIATDNQNLIADAVVVITGNPVLPEGETHASGFIESISSSLVNPNYAIDLDLSQTGSNLNTISESSRDSFYNCTPLQSIILSENFTTIGARAFNDLQKFKTFTMINTNENTSIEPGAFKDCESLETFNISGDGNKYYTAADGTVLLQRVESNNSSTILAASQSFTNLDLSDEEMFPDAMNPDSANHITAIASYAFYNKEQLNIESLGDVNSIGEKAFYRAKIPDLEIDFIPDANAFESAKITNLEIAFIPEANTFTGADISNLTVDCDVTRVNVGDFKSFIDSLERVTLHSVTFNEAVFLPDETIYWSFSYSNKYDNTVFNNQKTSLKSLTFNGNTQIGKGQFQLFNYLESLVCTGPTEIAEHAFYNTDSESYHGIANLDLSGVTSLGADAILIPVEYLKNGMLEYPPLIESMTASSFVMSDQTRNAISGFSIDATNTYYRTALGGRGLVDNNNELMLLAKSGMTSINFEGSGIEKISSDPLANFEGCSELNTVNLSGVKIIEDGAFLRCPRLKNFVAPSSLESISALAFVSKRGDDKYNSETETKITNITTADSGNYSQIGNVMLVDQNKVLVLLAHTSTAALDFSTYSNRINSIGTYACARHDEITSVDFTGIIDIQDAAFLNCYKLIGSFNWGETLQSIGNEAFSWTSAVYEYQDPNIPKIEMTFPSSLMILEDAFRGRECTTDSTITIQQSSAHPLALMEGTFAGYDPKVPQSSTQDNKTGMTLTLPETGTWYYIRLSSSYESDVDEDRAILKQYITSCIENTGNFTPDNSNSFPNSRMQISTLNMEDDEGVLYKQRFKGGYGWLYFKPN